MFESWGLFIIGGLVVMKIGLIFIGGFMDVCVWVLDVKIGVVLWKVQVDVFVVLILVVFDYKGCEYVLFIVGGNLIIKLQVGD